MRRDLSDCIADGLPCGKRDWRRGLGILSASDTGCSESGAVVLQEIPMALAGAVLSGSAVGVPGGRGRTGVAGAYRRYRTVWNGTSDDSGEAAAS